MLLALWQNTLNNHSGIAPQAAAVEYGLEVIAQDIQEISENFTRFGFWG